MKKQYLVTVIVAVVVAAGGFFGGMTFQKSSDSLKGLSGQALTTKMQSLGLGSTDTVRGGAFSTNGNFPTNGTFPGGTNGARRFGGGGLNAGQIVSMDSTSITIKLTDGSTKVIYYSGTTAITKTATGTASDLAVGTEISATGTSNSDGSITAQDIRINPNIPNPNTNAAPVQ